MLVLEVRIVLSCRLSKRIEVRVLRVLLRTRRGFQKREKEKTDFFAFVRFFFLEKKSTTTTTTTTSHNSLERMTSPTVKKPLLLSRKSANVLLAWSTSPRRW